jgi:hypothetical protein
LAAAACFSDHRANNSKVLPGPCSGSFPSLWAADAVGRQWHLRLHRLRSPRRLEIQEQGFALGRDALDDRPIERSATDDALGALATTQYGSSAVFDIAVGRDRPRVLRHARVLHTLPATNVIQRRTVIPRLVGSLDPGTHWLACAVFASENAIGLDELLEELPDLPPDAFDWFE